MRADVLDLRSAAVPDTGVGATVDATFDPLLQAAVRPTSATWHGRPDGESIAYTLDTKRARTEIRAQPVQKALLQSLIGEAADDSSQDLSIRRTLFRLLVPVDLQPFLTGRTDAQFEVDSGTAGIPWELLDDATSERSSDPPWAIRTKLLRKLRTTEFRAQVADADAEASVLVIGEPECDPTYYPPLLGAQREALAVVTRSSRPVDCARIRWSR